jgi:hypothetical protein
MNQLTELFKKPVVAAVASLVVGLLLGLLFAWQIWPVQWVDAPASLLRADLREDYMRMSIDSFRVNGNTDLAVRRYLDLEPYAFDVFQKVKENPNGIDPVVIDLYRDVLKQAGVIDKPAGGTTTPATGGETQQPASSSSGLSFFIILGALLAVGLVGAAVFYLFRTSRRTGPLTPAQQAAELNKSLEKTDFSQVNQAPPVAQYVTSYVLGDDLFDDSFSIDSPAGEFLGECGVGISETIGVGEPKKVTAFEVWMFDKNDIQTVTKVLMSPHAFADPNIRGRLESKGEMVKLEPRKQVVLETQTLQMVASISDIQFGQGALPEGSYFERITLELAIWSK